jgi:SAM-dependent methyltransferase
MIRKSLGKLRRRLKQEIVHWKRRRGELDPLDWKSGLLEENDFWTRALTDPERHWNINEYRERTNPDFELQPELRALIPAAEGATVRILDVGAGPLTCIGKKWPGRKLEITATDPLAEKYAVLVKQLNVPLLIPVTVAEAEKLTGTFPKNHFDLTYAHNCLDHSYDPVLAIQQMVEVVKPGHCAYLWHFANEGKKEFYAGLHQWNFFSEGNRFMISDARVTHSMNELFGAAAEITCEETRAFGNDVVIAKIKKLKSS